MLPFEQLGPYRIGRRLGRGGMGTVFEGLDTTTGAPAAVKVLSAAMAHEEGFRERFEAEIESLKLLRHPNIVRLFGYGQQDGYLFYAMELVNGSTLEEELQRARRFHWREVTDFGVHLAKALKHAHDRGVIHRDIKPANVLLDAHDEVKLSDFGIAKLFGMSGLTADGGVLGTAEYMAPEQADGRLVTFRCDLYSLGGVLYALLAGRPPFRATTLPEMLQLQRFAQPDPVRRYAPDAPAELEAILVQLLEKSPEARIANAMVLARRLEAMAHGLSVTTSGASSAPESEQDFELRGREALTQAPVGGPPSSLGETQVATSLDIEAAERIPETAPEALEPSEEQGPSTITSTTPKPRFTTVAEAEAEDRQRQAESETAPTVSIQIMALAGALVALGLVAWYMLQPASADALYAQISAASRTGGAAMAEVEPEIEEFVSRFPSDPRARQVEDYLQEIELARLERRLQRRAQRVGVGEHVPLAERAYFEAVAAARDDPERGLAKFQALIGLFSHEENPDRVTRDVLRLAQRQIGRLEPRLDAEELVEKKQLEQLLAQAREFQTSDPVRSRQMLQSIVELYGERRWAEAIVAEARRDLDSSEAKPPEEPPNPDAAVE